MVDRAVLEHADTSASSSSRAGHEPGSDAREGFDMVAASEWPRVPEQDVLLSPAQCRTLWRQFASDSNTAVQQVCRQLCLPYAGSFIMLCSSPACTV